MNHELCNSRKFSTKWNLVEVIQHLLVKKLGYNHLENVLDYMRKLQMKQWMVCFTGATK